MKILRISCRLWAFLLLLLLLLLPASGRAVGFRPLLTGFTQTEYGDAAGGQNWDATGDADGVMLFGNNTGVLRFDGYFWQHVPTGRAVRCVCVRGDTLYVGGHGEFGYMLRDAYGNYTYHPIAGRRSGGALLRGDEEVWNMVAIGTRLYLQTFSAVYLYDGHTSLMRLPLPGGGGVLSITTCAGRLYAQATGGDLFRLDGARWVRVVARAGVNGDDVVGIFPASERGGRLLLLTVRSGFFTLDESGHVTRWVTQMDGLLARGVVNRACLTAQGEVVVGTIRSGIFCIGKQGDLAWRYDAASGLPGNCVLRLRRDKYDNIWACLDGGLALIRAGGSFSTLGMQVGYRASGLGTPYALNIWDRRFLVATNQGIYGTDMDSADDDFMMFPGTEEHNWFLSVFDGTLIAGNNRGTLRYAGGGFQRVADTESSTWAVRTVLPSGEPLLFESSYHALRVYRWGSGGWKEPYTLGGFGHPLRGLEVDADGTLWGADMNCGVYRIRLDKDVTRAEHVDYYERVDSADVPCFITSFEGRVVFSDGSGLFYFDSETGGFVPCKKLTEVLKDDAKGVLRLVRTSDRNYWVCTKTGYTYLVNKGNDWRVSRRVRPAVFGMRCNDMGATVFEQGRFVYFNFADGIVRLDTHAEVRRLDVRLYPARASYTDKHGDWLPISLDDLRNGEAEAGGNIEIEYSFPAFSQEDIRFRFTVHGRGDMVIERGTPSLILPNLPAGHFTIKAEALDAGGGVLAVNEVEFSVPRPWYLRWWALLAYVVLFVFASVAISRFRLRRQASRNRLVVLEQQRIIDQQRQELLESQLKEKSKDLAAISLETAVANNALKEFSETLKEHQEKGAIPKHIKTEPLQIGSTADGNTTWQLFMQNFDFIHEHFFRNLKERYPNLTQNDLKLCGLLRLNLSTKEIANYTSLSVRGVESARLRLRRKLGLTSDQNIVEFLVTFK
ncbi:MAG: hypothetical protein J6M53_03120 [Bacteroidaceae bacterium]|nr:hypothetical protein [Bacteroidaceae bacterium]